LNLVGNARLAVAAKQNLVVDFQFFRLVWCHIQFVIVTDEICPVDRFALTRKNW
jgi:hypothetical protein